MAQRNRRRMKWWVATSETYLRFNAYYPSQIPSSYLNKLIRVLGSCLYSAQPPLADDDDDCAYTTM